MAYQRGWWRPCARSRGASAHDHRAMLQRHHVAHRCVLSRSDALMRHGAAGPGARAAVRGGRALGRAVPPGVPRPPQCVCQRRGRHQRKPDWRAGPASCLLSLLCITPKSLHDVGRRLHVNACQCNSFCARALVALSHRCATVCRSCGCEKVQPCANLSRSLPWISEATKRHSWRSFFAICRRCTMRCTVIRSRLPAGGMNGGRPDAHRLSYLAVPKLQGVLARAQSRGWRCGARCCAGRRPGS